MRDRIEACKEIAAPDRHLFALICSPNQQIQIDGSAMLQSAEGASLLSVVGDVFTVHMDREPLGDVPLGRYTVVNTVTAFSLNRQIEWNVAWPGSDPFGHVYGYQLEPIGESLTAVTSYCDWSNLADVWRGHIAFPVIPASMLERSLDNLESMLLE